MNVLAISGSLRAASSNTAVLRALVQLVGPPVTVELYDGLGALPHFNPDLDIDSPPSAVAELRAAIRRSQAIVISSPEYAHGVPGALKNALDWLVSGVEMTDMPVALIHTTPFAMYAPASLAETLRTIGARIVDDGCVTFEQGIRALSPDAIAADPALSARLRQAITALAAAC